MNIEDCIDDPNFREAFVEKEIEALNEIIEGNNNVHYYNEAKISIFNQMLKEQMLEGEELTVVNEHLSTLINVNNDLIKQKERFISMINAYANFLEYIKNNKKIFKLVQKN
jgi:hypothetical protein